MKSLLLALGCCLALPALAGSPGDSASLIAAQIKLIDSIESSLHYKTGQVTIGDGLATIKVAPGFKFLGASESKYIIEDVWGNLKGQNPLGMIVPANSGASYADYAFIVEYEEIGHVKDDDADKINYDDLMKTMKEESAEANKQRSLQGIAAMNIVGWAAKPYYDKERKLLYWAKEFAVEGADENTLNYDIRVLGRKGVLVLTAVSGISQLDSVSTSINPILSMVSFNKGNQYSDFDSNTDEIAAWTIGGLVAGKVLAKAGFFVIILKYLKFILLGLAAVGGAVWRFFKGRRKEAEDLQPVAYDQQPAETPQS
ncbi:MAG TPA: DUF2167 domain-containing protein [Flavisolibacter sp.]|nr:DUF2167 domain-containing protein [Flavisolibacter sp.]